MAKPSLRLACVLLVLVTGGCRRQKDGLDSFVQVAAGRDTTCARTKRGFVYCWGDDAYSSTSSTASSIPPGKRRTPLLVHWAVDVVDFDIGSLYGCAVDRSGALSCFRDYADLVPDRTLSLDARKTDVTDAVQVSMSVANSTQVCVRLRSGAVHCARGSAGGELPPFKKVEGIDDAVAVAAGDMQTCAIRANGDLYCWKSQNDEKAQDTGTTAKAYAVASARSCAIDSEDTVRCTVDSPKELKAKHLAVGVYHACAVDFGGHVHCWGENELGQLGERDGTKVRDVEGAIQVACGHHHSCALLQDGRILCWGRNHRGQLGDGTSTDSKKPREVAPAP